MQTRLSSFSAFTERFRNTTAAFSCIHGYGFYESVDKYFLQGFTSRWISPRSRRATQVSLGPDSGVLRDQFHTTYGPEVDYMEAS